MFIHGTRIFHPRDKAMSPALVEVSEAGTFARALVDLEARRIGSREAARVKVARTVGASPGTIENLTRQPPRLKRIGGWLRDALRNTLVAAIDRQIVALEHERQLLLQQGVDPRGDELAAVATDIAALLAARGR